LLCGGGGGESVAPAFTESPYMAVPTSVNDGLPFGDHGHRVTEHQWLSSTVAIEDDLIAGLAHVPTMLVG
jgi:hypothetical protein